MTESQLKKELRDLSSPATEEWLKQAGHNLEVYATLNSGVTGEPESRIHPMLYKFYTSLQMSSGTKIIMVVLLAVGGLLLLGGGVALAADPAKPGDALHSVDLAVESVQRSLKFGDDAKADFEIDVLDERMEELAELDEEGEDLGDALEEVSDQQDRLYLQMREMEENGEGVDEGEKERIWTRYEDQCEYHYEYMEQLQERLHDGTGSDTGSGEMNGTENGNGNASDETETESEDLLNTVTDDFRSGGPDFDGPGNYIQKQDRDQDNTPEDPGGEQNGPQYGIEDEEEVED